VSFSTLVGAGTSAAFVTFQERADVTSRGKGIGNGRGHGRSAGRGNVAADRTVGLAVSRLPGRCAGGFSTGSGRDRFF